MIAELFRQLLDGWQGESSLAAANDIGNRSVEHPFFEIQKYWKNHEI